MGQVERVSIEEARALIQASGKKRHKFGAKALTVDGHRFPSKLEARRYGQLKTLARVGAIQRLALQPRFTLCVDGVDVGTYVADFSYFETKGAGYGAFQVHVVEDAKGVVLPLYRLKRALFRVLYPLIDFREVKK